MFPPLKTFMKPPPPLTTIFTTIFSIVNHQNSLQNHWNYLMLLYFLQYTQCTCTSFEDFYQLSAGYQMTLILTLNKPCRILKIAKINVTLVYYILCRIYWPTTFRGPTKTTTITITGSDETSPGTREYRTWWVILMYCILTKERPWVEHLTSLPRAFFWVFLHLTMKEHPCHVYSK